MKLATRIVVLGTVVALVAYDIAAYAIGGVDATISRVLLRWASDIPIIMLAPGVLIGHLFWPQPTPSPYKGDDEVTPNMRPPRVQ